MKMPIRVAIFASVGLAAVAALNQSGLAVPGLDWVRIDTLMARVGLGPQPPTAETADGTAKVKRGSGGGSNGGGGRRAGQDGPVPVVVAKAERADVPVYLRGVGSARAMNTVTVRPQVDGKLIKVEFREGQDVKRGDLLALIDPVTYQAALDQANAKLRLTQSQLTNAELDLDRYTKTGPGVVAQKTIDTQRSQVTQLQAQLKSDAAAIASAEAVLAYTKITSPIDGRTGQRLVDEGNLVRSGDAGIVTIAQIRPIAVQFTLPQQQLAQVTAAQKVGSVRVEAMDGDDKTVLDTGTLSFIDNQIDQTTGSVKMKADLSNERLQLWPGQFANVRVRVDVLKDAITVPTAAVQRGPQGTFVFVATDSKSSAPRSSGSASSKPQPNEPKPNEPKPAEVNGGESKRADAPRLRVAVRTVIVAQQDDKVAVLTSGLEIGDAVVTSGFARLKDQVEVTITRTDGATAPLPTTSVPETGAVPGKQPVEQLRRAEGESDKGERRGKRGKPQESAVQ
jgi:multidrug efflux system membrane fusion protein